LVEEAFVGGIEFTNPPPPVPIDKR
jgi:hypothetical protein